ncbi:MAG: OmpA family protein [Desulfomonile tiedjei]|uniref:OmpA family protein n=1 Tax=Desulfomonile tiedjei TaxID=2358 RepID=A0A9D6V403_9BACT|nr:OmpA family protein [Desulfomonile tiedjei]
MVKAAVITVVSIFILTLGGVGYAETWEEYQKLKEQGEAPKSVTKGKGAKVKGLKGVKQIVVEMDETCKIALTSESLLFEYGKATLTSDPNNASNLNMIAEAMTKYLSNDPAAKSRRAAVLREMRPSGKAKDKSIGARKGECNYSRFNVDGHTCDIGSDENNCRLSWMRANKIIEELASRGVDRKMLVARGFGEKDPQNPNDSEDKRRLNRRVVIFSVEGEGVPDKAHMVCKEQSGAVPSSVEESSEAPTSSDSEESATEVSDRSKKTGKGGGLKPVTESQSSKTKTEPPKGLRPVK